MSDELQKQERAAIEAVARHFAAPWEKGEGRPHAYVAIGGKRIAVAVTTIGPLHRGANTKPHLRFDKVALGLVRRLHVGLDDGLPAGKTVLVTVTAPIKLPAKTAEALEKRIRACLSRPAAPKDMRGTIHGNRIRVRVVTGSPRGGPKLIGFVHNPDSDPVGLMNLAQALLERVGAEEHRVAAGFAGDRWLVIANESGSPQMDVYRHVCSKLSTGFRKILMVRAGGRVETLTE